MAGTIERSIVEDETLITEVELPNTGYFNTEVMQQWLDAQIDARDFVRRTSYVGLPRVKQTEVDGLQDVVDTSASNKVGSCALGGECRITAEMPGAFTGEASKTALRLQCPVLQTPDAEEEARDKERCSSFHHDVAPVKFMMAVSMTMTKYNDLARQKASLDGVYKEAQQGL